MISSPIGSLRTPATLCLATTNPSRRLPPQPAAYMASRWLRRAASAGLWRHRAASSPPRVPGAATASQRQTLRATGRTRLAVDLQAIQRPPARYPRSRRPNDVSQLATSMWAMAAAGWQGRLLQARLPPPASSRWTGGRPHGTLAAPARPWPPAAERRPAAGGCPRSRAAACACREPLAHATNRKRLSCSDVLLSGRPRVRQESKRGHT